LPVILGEEQVKGIDNNSDRKIAEMGYKLIFNL
jgi:hypothetical protein